MRNTHKKKSGGETVGVETEAQRQGEYKHNKQTNNNFLQERKGDSHTRKHTHKKGEWIKNSQLSISLPTGASTNNPAGS